MKGELEFDVMYRRPTRDGEPEARSRANVGTSTARPRTGGVVVGFQFRAWGRTSRCETLVQRWSEFLTHHGRSGVAGAAGGVVGEAVAHLPVAMLQAVYRLHPRGLVIDASWDGDRYCHIQVVSGGMLYNVGVDAHGSVSRHLLSYACTGTGLKATPVRATSSKGGAS
jgi:hypothetical protein